MKTWHIVLIVGICVVTMLMVVAGTLYAISDHYDGYSKEEILVATVHNKYPESTNTPDSRIINIAKDTCAQLDAGNSVRATINNIASKYPSTVELDFDVTAYTMVEGIQQLCPQHVEKAREFANG